MRFVCLFVLALRLCAADNLSLGDVHFQQSNWSAAAEAYSAAAKDDPNSGAAWFKLGQAYRRLSKNQDAVTAFQKAIALNYQPAGAMVRVAGALGADGKDAEAVQWLHKAAEAGFAMPGVLQSDTVLARLAAIPDAQPAVARMTDNLRVCSKRPEYKQLDFWIGNWTVTMSGTVVGTNRIEKTLDGCALIENWVATNGIAGKSLNLYDAAAKKWRQRWVDETGRMTDYVGEFRDGAMRFEATMNGQPARMTFTPMEGGRVRQLIEQSTDNGKSWTSTFDGMYAKTN
jgi:tetratricopeptide (TPR) repeat protein